MQRTKAARTSKHCTKAPGLSGAAFNLADAPAAAAPLAAAEGELDEGGAALAKASADEGEAGLEGAAAPVPVEGGAGVDVGAALDSLAAFSGTGVAELAVGVACVEHALNPKASVAHQSFFIPQKPLSS